MITFSWFEPLLPQSAPAMIVLGAFGDRIWGMERAEWAKTFPVKGSVLGVMAIGAFLTFALFGLVATLAWFVWRAPAWKDVFSGSATPVGPEAIIRTLLRHMLATPLLGLAAYWGGLDWRLGVAAGVVFAIVAAALAAWYGAANAAAERDRRDIGNENVIVELARGAAFWASLYPVALFSGRLAF